MGIVDERRALFDQAVKLRRAERQAPGVREIPEVRAQLERRIGSGVSMSLAAQILGVSPSTLSRHVKAGSVPVVPSVTGRPMVPVGALEDLYEQVERNRASGRTHVLEPIAQAAHRSARRIAGDPTLTRAAPADPHERASARSLAYHQAVARKLTRAMATDALHRIWEWQSQGRIDDRYAEQWEELLARPVREIKREISKPDQRMRDLRQSSPFAGVLSELERREILRQVR